MQLENIYFRAPEFIADRNDMLSIVAQAELDNINRIRQDESSYKIDDEIFYIKDIDHSSVVYLPNQLEFIGSDAFSSDINIKILIIENDVNEVCSNIIDGWNDNNQIVLVHNQKKIEYGKGKWAEDWAARFTNYQFDKEIYTIHFDPKGGDLAIETMDVEYGEKIDVLPEPTWDMHRFNGWRNSKNFQIFDYEFLPAKEDLYLEADWSLQYKVNLKSQDGSKLLSTVYAVYGEYLPVKDIFGNNVKISNEPGTDFDGYFNSDKSTRYYAYLEDGLVATNAWDIRAGGDLFAKNTEVEYQIIYTGADIGNLNNPNPIVFKYKDVIDNSFSFIPILKSNQKIYWSLNNIGEAKNTNYLETRILYITGTQVTRQAKITYTGISYGTVSKSYALQ